MSDDPYTTCASDLPGPYCSDELFSAGVLEEDVLFVAVGVDIVCILGVFLIGHANSGVDQRHIVLFVLV